MTFIRKIVRGENVYLYRVTSYREGNKVRQRSVYLGKGSIENNDIVKEPKKNINVRRVFDTAPYIMYKVAEDFGIFDDFIPAIDGLTDISDASRKIVELAIMNLLGTAGSIEMHTGLKEGTVKEKRDLIQFLGSENPDIISILESSISKRIVESYGKSGIVYDLSAVKYYGISNELARYGHYYSANGNNKEVNFVLAVTRNSGIPVHHRIMHGNIVSVDTIKPFIHELKDYNINTVLIVMDRGFYSESNIESLNDYSIISAIPATLNIYMELIKRSFNIEDPANYIKYNDETLFFIEYVISGKRYIVYFSPVNKSIKINAFYSRLSDIEISLKELQNIKFNNSTDMVKTVLSLLKGYKSYIDIEFSENSFTYSLNNKNIKSRTSRMGYFILFTNIILGPYDVLNAYRKKDVVEKAFLNSKKAMEPLYAHTVEGTRSKVFLSILGYSIVSMIGNRLNFTYANTLKVLTGIKEVLYTNGRHSPVELTKEQKLLLEKLSIEL